MEWLCLACGKTNTNGLCNCTDDHKVVQAIYKKPINKIEIVERPMTLTHDPFEKLKEMANGNKH